MEITQQYSRSHSFIHKKRFDPAMGSDTSPNMSILVFLIIAAGIGVRLFHYFYNRSLWTDEIYLSTSLIRMSYLELTSPMLDYEQKAPIGFLWLVRSAVLLFGTSEMALRLIPLLSGVASLLLFVPVCRHFLKPMGTLVALSILALAPPLVNHAVEIKQYGMELLVTIVALRLYIKYRNQSSFSSLMQWGMFGALLIWFSYSAIFVLAGMAIAVSFTHLFSQKWKELGRSLLPFSLWAASFAVFYFLFNYKHEQNDWLVNFFRFYGGFMPHPPRSAAKIGWYANAAYQLLYNPLGLLWNSSIIEDSFLRNLLKIPIIGFLFLVAGAFSFARFRKEWFLIVALPLVLHLAASRLERYPFMDRFIVYAAPLLLLFIGRGIDWVNGRILKGGKWRIIFPLLIVAGPAAGSAMQVINPTYFGGSKQSTQREALMYINEHYREGDLVYVYWNMVHAYQFYNQTCKLKFKAIEGSDVRFQSKNPEDYFDKLAPELSALAGKKRVWVVYNTKLDFNIGDDIRYYPHWYAYHVAGGNRLAAAIEKIGKQQHMVQTFDAHVRLYDLSESSLNHQEQSP